MSLSLSLSLSALLYFIIQEKNLIYGQYTFVDGLHTLSKVVASLQLYQVDTGNYFSFSPKGSQDPSWLS